MEHHRHKCVQRSLPFRFLDHRRHNSKFMCVAVMTIYYIVLSDDRWSERERPTSAQQESSLEIVKRYSRNFKTETDVEGDTDEDRSSSLQTW